MATTRWFSVAAPALGILESAERWSLDEHCLLLIHSAGADEPSCFAPFEE